MPLVFWALVAFGALLAIITALALSAQRSRAALIELARLVRPCVALFRAIMRDPEVPRRARLIPALVVAYLAVPIDLIPDFAAASDAVTVSIDRRSSSCVSRSVEAPPLTARSMAARSLWRAPRTA